MDGKATGQADMLQHGARRYRIGRRDDRAQRGAGGPGQAGHQHMRDQRDDRRGEDDRAHRQRDDAQHMAMQVAERDEPGAVHQ